MIDLGIVKPGSTIYIPFASFAGSTGAPSAMTGLATSDILVYKDGGTTQRASASGFTLLDTDGLDFDALTGINGVSIDLADNTTAGFWAAGSRYFIVIGDVTVDSQTLRFVAATFMIGLPGAVLNTTIATLASQTSFTLTAGPAEDDALNGCVVYIHDVASAVQGGFAVVSDYTGSTKTVTLAAGTTYTAAATDNVMVMPPANLWAIGGITTAVTNAGNFFTSTGYTNANNSIGSVSGAVGSVTGNVGGNVVGSVGSIGTNGITAASLATDAGAEIADAIWDEVVDGSTTARQSIRGINSAALGKASGLNSTTALYRDLADTKNRISATVDTDGNRSAITLDLT